MSASASKPDGAPAYALRRGLVVAAGGVLLAVFAIRLRDHLIDEMPLFALAAWIAVVALAARIAGVGTGDRTSLVTFSDDWHAWVNDGTTTTALSIAGGALVWPP